MSITKGWLGLYLWMDEKRQKEIVKICQADELQQTHPLQPTSNTKKEAKIIYLRKE